MESFDVANQAARMPLYRALQRELQQAILNGTYKPGDWLPSESELRREHRVSATSVRRALLELSRLGLIQRFQGRGSMVTSSEIRTASSMVGIGQELRQRGHEVRADVLVNTDANPAEHVRHQLQLPEGARIRHIRRAYFADSRPVILLDHWLPPKPGIDYSSFNGGSFYDFLAVHDLLPRHAHEQVFAAGLNASDAEALQASVDGPALVRDRTSYLVDGTPIEFTRHTSVGDRYRMEVDLEMHS